MYQRQIFQGLNQHNFDNEYYLSLYRDVAEHPGYKDQKNAGWQHWQQFGRHEKRQARALPVITLLDTDNPMFDHRCNGYALLQGHGLEIGALHQPAAVPDTCQMMYCDAMFSEAAWNAFPELSVYALVSVDVTCDADKEGLAPFADAQFDFVVLNHVIEHVANPLHLLSELFRVVRTGGCVVLSAPDKDYTYDKPRALTPFKHLCEEFEAGVTTVTDEHYLDFMAGYNPDWLKEPEAVLQKRLQRLRTRRGHVHVWNSASFSDFMEKGLAYLQITANCAYCISGPETQFEYFSVWQKGG